MKDLLKPPVMSDPDLQRRTSIGYYLLLLALVLAPLLGLFSALTGAVVQAATTFLMTGSFLFTFLLLRRGRVVLANRIFLVIQWVILAFVVTFFSGGLSSPGFVVFFLGIILSGFMDTGRSALALTGATIVLAGYLTIAELSGTLPSGGTTVPLPVRWFIYSVSLAISGTGIYLATRNMRQYIQQLQTLNVQNEALLDRLQASNAQLKTAAEQLRQQNAYLASLHQVTLSLIDRLALSDLLQAVVTRVADLLPGAEGFLYLYDDVSGALIMRAATGGLTEYLGRQVQPGTGISGTVFERQERVVTADYSRSRFANVLHPDEIRHDAVAVLPLRSGGEMFGVIGVTRQRADQPFTDDEVSLLDRFAELASIALDNARLYSAAQQELTERRQAERELRIFQAAIENTMDGVLLIDADGIRFANPAVAEMLGYDEMSDLLGSSWTVLLDPEVTDDILRAAEEHLTTDGQWRIRLSGRRRDGTTFPCEASLTQLESGIVVILVRDLTQQEKARQALVRSEATSRALLEAIPDAMFRIARDGTMLDSHLPAGFRNLALPFPLETLHGRPIDEMVDDDLLVTALDAMKAALDSGEVQTFEYYGEAGQRHVEVRLKAISDQEVVFIVRDITERRQAEEALRQAHKLESLGVLAGGVAHDFNNLLTGILAQTSLAAYQLPEESPVRRHVTRAMQSAERAADLTRQLLAYAGKAQFAVGVLDLNQLIQENSGLLETAVPRRVTLFLDLEQDVAPVEADRGQIQQVLMNLVINGAEAIGAERGTIRISTLMAGVESEGSIDHFVGGMLPEPGEYACLEVTDTGCGIAPETLDRIFDPFFSTKSDGRGLGLSSTLGIIRTHGGALEVISNVGQGTTFRAYFPISTAAEVVLQPQAEESAVARQNARVLIVDDEQPVREAAQDVLEAAGYEVLTAADGMAGLALYEEYGETIDCVLLDMKMPGMDGEKTLRRLRQLDPGVSCILSSGYSEMELHDNPVTEGVRFLQKPYNLEQLLRTVEQTLSKSDRS